MPKMFDFCIVILNFLFKTAAKRANRMSRKRYKNAPQTAPSTRPVTRPARHPTPPKPSRQTPLRGPSPHPKTSPHPAPKRPVPGRPEPAPRGLTRRAAPLSERQPAQKKSPLTRQKIAPSKASPDPSIRGPRQRVETLAVHRNHPSHHPESSRARSCARSRACIHARIPVRIMRDRGRDHVRTRPGP